MFEDILTVDRPFNKDKFTKEGKCPFCGSSSYDADYNDHEVGKWVELIYECDDCGREWVERYKGVGDIKEA